GATSTSGLSRAASVDGSPCRGGFRPSRAPWHEERLHGFHRRRQLVALNRAGRIDVLGAHLGALADECAPPDPFVLGEHFHSSRSTLITVVEVVPLRERNGRWPDELRVEAVNRGGRVAKHAVDAHAVLLVLVELSGGLAVLALRKRLLYLPHEPWLHSHELAHEVAAVDHEARVIGQLV